jgi:hypothetical protein
MEEQILFKAWSYLKDPPMETKFLRMVPLPVEIYSQINLFKPTKK